MNGNNSTRTADVQTTISDGVGYSYTPEFGTEDVSDKPQFESEPESQQAEIEDVWITEMAVGQTVYKLTVVEATVGLIYEIAEIGDDRDVVDCGTVTSRDDVPSLSDFTRRNAGDSL